jgi:hypothetical protein
MILVQIATALAIGAYVVLSKDARPKRPDVTPRQSFQRPADHLLDRDGGLSSRRFITTFSSPARRYFSKDQIRAARADLFKSGIK